MIDWIQYNTQQQQHQQKQHICCYLVQCVKIPTHCIASYICGGRWRLSAHRADGAPQRREEGLRSGGSSYVSMCHTESGRVSTADIVEEQPWCASIRKDPFAPLQTVGHLYLCACIPRVTTRHFPVCRRALVDADGSSQRERNETCCLMSIGLLILSYTAPCFSCLCLSCSTMRQPQHQQIYHDAIVVIARVSERICIHTRSVMCYWLP